MDSTASARVGKGKLQPPKLEKNDGTGKYRKTAGFENWENDLKDMLKVGEQDPKAEDTIICLGWHLEGVAKILHASFRRNPATHQLCRDDFLETFRKYCICLTNKNTMWTGFQAVRESEKECTKASQR